jgi:hypothetical protein
LWFSLVSQSLEYPMKTQNRASASFSKTFKPSHALH